jgi:hypothetical protein
LARRFRPRTHRAAGKPDPREAESFKPVAAEVTKLRRPLPRSAPRELLPVWFSLRNFCRPVPHDGRRYRAFHSLGADAAFGFQGSPGF